MGKLSAVNGVNGLVDGKGFTLLPLVYMICEQHVHVVMAVVMMDACSFQKTNVSRILKYKQIQIHSSTY